jgi:HK97 family phage major capsid protein
MYTANGGPILPEEVSALVVQPVTSASVATQTATVVMTGSHTFRIPRVTEDPTAAWVAEGAEITPDDMTLDEIDVTPSKVAGLTIISRELADDSDPAANNVVGDGLARDIARKVDAAFFGALASPAPSGLGALTGTTAVAAGTAFTNLDPFAEAMSEAEQLGATLTAFVANPADALTLAQLKDASGSNRPLLGVDPTQPTRRTIFGVPLYVSPDVTAGTVWGYDRAKVWVVMRDDAKIEVDRSVYFTSDRVAIKATMRVGFAFPHPATVVEITTAEE